MKKVRILFLFLIVALMLCSPMHAEAASSNAPKSVQLKQSRQVTAYAIKGQTIILKAKSGLVWTSSRPSVATVTQNGVVKALKKGNTLIKAKGSGIWYTCAFIVETPSINKTSLEMEIGDRRILEITGTKQKVKWRSGDTKVAVVDDAGWVVAKGQGRTKITAFVGAGVYTCKIKVNAEEGSPGKGDSEGIRVTYPDENHLQPDDEVPESLQPDQPETTDEPVTQNTTYYILNKNSKKFHRSDCFHVKQMKEYNKEESRKSYDQIIADGYKPCSDCLGTTQ